MPVMNPSRAVRANRLLKYGHNENGHFAYKVTEIDGKQVYQYFNGTFNLAPSNPNYYKSDKSLKVRLIAFRFGLEPQ